MAERQVRAGRDRSDDVRSIEDSLATRDVSALPAPEVLLPAAPARWEAGRAASLVRQTRVLQSSRGNQHVQRLVQRSAAVQRGGLVQRAGGNTVTLTTGAVRRYTYDLAGTTLEEVAEELEGRGEAGRGGADPINYSYQANASGIAHRVTITATLFTELPRWPARAGRPRAERTEYDRAMGVLRAHENRHVTIARNRLNAMKTSLKGLSVSDLQTRWDEKIAALQQAQQDYDTTSDHGRNEGTLINLP